MSPRWFRQLKKRGNLKLLQQKCQNRYVFRSVGGWSGLGPVPPGMIYYESILMLYSSGLATIYERKKVQVWLVVSSFL